MSCKPSAGIHQRYFDSRYSPDRNRQKVWKAICEYLQVFIPADGVVLDIGAGYCDFINQINASRKYALDVNPDVVDYCAPGVRFLGCDVGSIDLLRQSVDVVMASNFLEKRRRIKRGFSQGVGGDAATEPHKTGCWGHPEEEFSGTHNRLRPLDSADKDFLSSMCAYLGMALHNAWVHHQLLESKKNQEDLRVVRDRLAHTDKLSAMGELVAGIIHGMRNPMAIALGQCQLLLRETGLDSAAGIRAGKIEASIDRAVKVAQNFLSFAREGSAERMLVDINNLIRQTADLLAFEFKTNDVVLEIGLEQVPLTTVDAGSIQQVLLNILKNAQQAACEQRKRGTVSVQSRFRRSANAIRIEVADDGPGIPDTIQARIFEAFFTTKPRECGTGLGLAVSKRIVEEHQGTLSFQSIPGQGTRSSKRRCDILQRRVARGIAPLPEAAFTHFSSPDSPVRFRCRHCGCGVAESASDSHRF